MKVFVINLEREIDKKNRIIIECEKLNLNFDIYNAIDGNKLSKDFLSENVLDYGNNFLTNGEIGCSLSHINLYKKIVNDKLPYALILEDDAIMSDELVVFLSAFEKHNKKDGIFLLTGEFDYVENKKTTLGKFDIFPVTRASMTTGYIITNRTAKRMVDFLLPVRFEADRFKMFRFCAGVNIFATIPHIISTNDKGKESSSIEVERSLLINDRMSYVESLFKKDKGKRKLANFFWRVFSRKFEKVKGYTEY